MTKVSTLKQDGKLSYDIKVQTAKDKFVIPVIDVRDGEVARDRVNQIIKSQHRSKFTNPSYSAGGNSYQVSQKKSY